MSAVERSQLPEWWSGKATKRRQNARSRLQERRVARESGGRVQAGSGSSWRAPQDVVTHSEMIQHKGTERRSFSVRLDAWQALAADASRAGKDPVMIIEFADGTRLRVTEL